MTLSTFTTCERILVTGATGFVGRQIVKLLLDLGCRVAAVQHNSKLPYDLSSRCETIFSGDITNSSFQKEIVTGCKIICHTAAHIPSKSNDDIDAEKSYQINSLASLGLVSAASLHCVNRFIYISSANLYGNVNHECDESTLPNPTGVAANYFISKLAGEKYITNVCMKNKMDYVILRIGTPFGPGEPDIKAIPSFLKSSILGKPIRITNGGLAKYNFVYVEDIAQCVLSAITKGSSGIYNIGSGESVSIFDVVQNIGKIFKDVKIAIENENIPNGNFHGFASISIKKACNVFNFYPTSLHDGLLKYINFLKTYLGLP